jgi:hypothetical protein
MTIQDIVQNMVSPGLATHQVVSEVSNTLAALVRLYPVFNEALEPNRDGSPLMHMDAPMLTTLLQRAITALSGHAMVNDVRRAGTLCLRMSETGLIRSTHFCSWEREI